MKTSSTKATSMWKWMVYFILIGIIAGAGSIVFHLLTTLGSHVFLDLLAGYRPPSAAGEPPLLDPSITLLNRWILLLLPALGGLLSGVLVYTLCPEAAGAGNDAAIEAYHEKGGFIRGRVPIIKTIASALTLSTGGSGGREGPIAQIGGGFGSFLATRLKLSDRERRIMLAAGMGAGIGAIFRAPLAGALFAAEVMYREMEFESEIIIPSGISSVVAYCLFCLVFGWGSLFESPPFAFTNPLQLGPYLVLAAVVIAFGILYIKAFFGMQGVFQRLRVPRHVKPAIGGLCTGIIGFFLPEALGLGYGFVQLALENQLPVLLLLAIAVGKIFTTSFSIGSGGSGGVFGPSMVIGGCLGGVVGKTANIVLPGVVTEPGAFVIVGMAGFFTAVSNTPISTIIFVSEMTNSYHLLLPSLLVCALAFVFSRRYTIFSKQVPTKLDSKAHAGDFFVDILENIRVRELLPFLRNVEIIPEDMPFRQFTRLFSKIEQHYFPVVNGEGRFTGIFSINDVRKVLFSQDIGDLVVMKDIARSDIIMTSPSEDLSTVLRKFTMRNIDSLPVVRDDDPSVLLGMLRRYEVIQFYNREVERIKSGAETVNVRAGQEISVLKQIPVKHAMTGRAESVGEDAPVGRLREIMAQSKFHSFPVVDDRGHITGIVSASDYQRRADSPQAPGGARAGDVATRKVVTVNMEDDLLTAFERMAAGDFAILPVLRSPHSRKLVGVISRGDILRTYNEVVLKRAGKDENNA
jgi:CIC family chloride channel protein